MIDFTSNRLWIKFSEIRNLTLRKTEILFVMKRISSIKKVTKLNSSSSMNELIIRRLNECKE